MKEARKRGFTLIELLTVIAIITILAGLTFAVFPTIREKAKLRRTDNAFLQFRNAMTMYYTEHNGYPPGYGFMGPDMRNYTPAQRNAMTDKQRYFLRPYTSFIRFYDNEKMYDEFSDSYDTNRDNSVGIAEFSPIAQKDLVSEALDFPDDRFPNPSVNFNGQRDLQLNTDPRPYIYAPVNMSQFKRLRKYWLEKGIESGGPDGFYGQFWDPNDPLFPSGVYDSNGTFLVPQTYDAFVLISVGPGGSTFGVVPTDNTWLQNMYSNFPEEIYHIIALRTYFLATRDLNDNDQPDLEFRARSSQGEAALEYSLQGVPVNNMLPDPVAPNGWGPYIFAVP